MGKLLQGVNGPFTGKLGTAVGVTWKGIAVIRAKPKRRNVPFSPRELQQQAKFSLMSKFLHPLIDMLNLTFKSNVLHVTGYNKAFSYNVKNAFAGFHPDLSLDFSRVLLSQGDLPNAENPKVHVAEEEKLIFTWTDNKGKGKAMGKDQAFAAAYCDELKKWEYEMYLAPRTVCTCTLELPEFKNKTVHTWLGFISMDGKEVTESLYLGPVTVAP